MDTIKMGKRGTLVLPAKLRKQFGLEDGSLIATEAIDGEIRLRPAVAYEVEIYTPERMAEFHLNNALTREEFDWAIEEVKRMGLDPAKIPYTDLRDRDTLLTNADLDRKLVANQTKAENGRRRAS